jgi:hypothetical protein
MSWEASLAIGIPASVAVGGYFATYRHNLRLAARNDRLDRLNRQLEELYGPLIALGDGEFLVDVSHAAFNGMDGRCLGRDLQGPDAIQATDHAGTGVRRYGR